MIDFCGQTDFEEDYRNDGLNIFYCNVNFNHEVSTYCDLTLDRSVQTYDRQDYCPETSDIETHMLRDKRIHEKSSSDSKVDVSVLKERLERTINRSLKILEDPNYSLNEVKKESNNMSSDSDEESEKLPFKKKHGSPRKNRKLRCSTCRVEFCEIMELLQHMQDSHNPINLSLTCDQCSEVFPLAYQLQAHKESIHGETSDIMCGFCTTTFTETALYINHMKTLHASPSLERTEGSLNCNICGKMYTDAKLFLKHQRYHRKPFKCDQCPKSFPYQSALKKHQACHSDERPFECKKCPSRFPHKQALAEHMKTIHFESTNSRTKLNPLQCKICGKTFIYKCQLKVHMTSHSEDRPFNCDICNRKFRRDFELVNHKFAVHDIAKPGTKTFTCDICPKSFLSESNLKYHKYTHDETPSFTCDMCSGKFSTPMGLKLHRSVHFPEENKFKCEYCDKSFPKRARLQLHVRVHTGERPHCCQNCNAKFNTKGNLTAHIKSVHGVYMKTLSDKGSVDMKLVKYKRPSKKRSKQPQTVEEQPYTDTISAVTTNSFNTNFYQTNDNFMTFQYIE